MKVLVTGAGGLVGRAVCSRCTSAGEDVVGLDHRRLDISDPQSVKTIVNDSRPDVIINCAAWTDVDGCESDPAHAQAANGLGPELLASACRDIDALLVTISTDYVFDGSKDVFYTQEDEPNPISVYGSSKLEGELRALAASPRTIVVRSGYIFGSGGNNFLSTFLARVRRHTDLPLVVGFGISNAMHVRQVGAHAQGAIVGSALVGAIDSAAPGQYVAAATEFLRSLQA